MLIRIFPLVLSALLLSAAPVGAYAEAFSAEQKSAIQDIIKEYLTQTNPQVVFEAANEAQRLEQEKQQRVGQEAVSKNEDKLFKNPDSPVGGNPKGDVTIVEFFDYQCGYCKQAFETTKKLMEEDKNVRFIYKQYPVLGPNSQYLAKAAVAAQLQGKFEEFHNAVMGSKDRLDEAGVKALIGKLGLDAERFAKDIESEVVGKRIDASLALGQEIGVRGTPGFVVGGKVVPGARPLEDFKRMIAEARSATR